MREPTSGPIDVQIGEWRVSVDRLPPTTLALYLERADLVAAFGIETPDHDGYVFAGVSGPGEDWPSLVIRGTYGPAEGGFRPGVLVVPSTGRVFLGAGCRAVSFVRVRTGWRQDWAVEVEGGFWGWSRHGNVVVMVAELEMAAWSLDGIRLWSTLVEPPWSYAVIGDTVRLDVTGRVTEFPLLTGPS